MKPAADIMHFEIDFDGVVDEDSCGGGIGSESKQATTVVEGLLGEIQHWKASAECLFLRFENVWRPWVEASTLADSHGWALRSLGPNTIPDVVELVWDKILHAPVDATSSVPLTRALLCIPSCLWKLGIPEHCTMNHARRMLQAVGQVNEDGQVTLTQYQSAVIGMVDDLLATQQRCQTYRRGALCCLLTLIILGLFGTAVRAAAPFVLLAALVLGPVAGILVMLEMDETSKLRGLWRPTPTAAEAAVKRSTGVKTSVVPLNGGLSAELLELLALPLDAKVSKGNEEDEERLLTLISGLKGDELFNALETAELMKADTQVCLRNELSSNLVALGHEQLSVGTMGSSGPMMHTREIMSPGRMSGASTFSPKLSTACSTPAPNSRASMTPVKPHPSAVPYGPPKLSMEGDEDLDSNSSHTTNAVHAPKAFPTEDTHHASAQTLPVLPTRSSARTDILSSRASSTFDNVMHRIRSRMSTDTAVRPPDSHRMTRKARKAREKAQKAAAEEAQKVLGWRVGGRKAEPTGKILHRPGVPGLSFQEYLPPGDVPGAHPTVTAFHPDEEDDDDDDDIDLDIPGLSLDLPYQSTMIAQVNPNHPMSKSGAMSTMQTSNGTSTRGGNSLSLDAGTHPVSPPTAPLQQQQQKEHKALAKRLKQKLARLVSKLSTRRSGGTSAPGPSSAQGGTPTTSGWESMVNGGSVSASCGARSSWEPVVGMVGSQSKADMQNGYGLFGKLRKSGASQPSTPGSHINTSTARSWEGQRHESQACGVDTSGVQGVASLHLGSSSISASLANNCLASETTPHVGESTTTGPSTHQPATQPDAQHGNKLMSKFSKVMQRLKA